MEKIEEIIQKLLNFLEISELEINIEEKEDALRISIRVPDAGLLIGVDGEILGSLEQILRLLIKKTGDQRRVILDINNYRLQKENYIREIAQKAGRQVMLTKKEVYLPPMNSYERRLVHLELSINPDIATESIGYEPERRVIIKSR